MRLLRLYLGDYRILRDLDIRFGPPGADDVGKTPGASYGLDFLVGVNSTGKSTVLQVIADLMRKLERHAPIPYAFELEYDLGPPEQTRRVKLSNLPDDFDAETPPPQDTVRLWVDGSTTQFSGDVLPPLIVAFTTGSEAEWERIDRAEPWSSGDPGTIQKLSPIEQALRELPGRPTRPGTQDDDSALRHVLPFDWSAPKGHSHDDCIVIGGQWGHSGAAQTVHTWWHARHQGVYPWKPRLRAYKPSIGLKSRFCWTTVSMFFSRAAPEYTARSYRHHCSGVHDNP